MKKFLIVLLAVFLVIALFVAGGWYLLQTGSAIPDDIPSVTLSDLQNNKVVEQIIHTNKGSIALVLKGEIVGVSGRTLTLQVDGDILAVFIGGRTNIVLVGSGPQDHSTDLPGAEISGENEEAVITAPGIEPIKIFGEKVTIVARLVNGGIETFYLYTGDRKVIIH